MTKEEVKQWLRSQIDSCIKIQDIYDEDYYFLCYNNPYLSSKIISKITGNPVNKDNFLPGDKLFLINIKNKTFWHYSIIWKYLDENYSSEHTDRINLLQEVVNEYSEFKGYKW